MNLKSDILLGMNVILVMVKMEITTDSYTALVHRTTSNNAVE